MKLKSSSRKKSIKALKQFVGDDFSTLFSTVLEEGRQGIDEVINYTGRALVEALLLIERDQMSGPSYAPTIAGRHKWASQQGSVYVGGQKVRIQRPRLRGPDVECPSTLYCQLKNKGQFSEDLLDKCLLGISSRNYKKVVYGATDSFGISRSSVSRRVVEATAAQLKEFQEKSLENIELFAVMIDSIYRGGHAFMVALGIDKTGKKIPLGMWEGATENHEMCLALLEDLEKRGLKLISRILFITDGGTGVIKAKKMRFGKGLLHQRCIIHKDRRDSVAIRCRFGRKRRIQGLVTDYRSKHL